MLIVSMKFILLMFLILKIDEKIVLKDFGSINLDAESKQKHVININKQKNSSEFFRSVNSPIKKG